MNARLLTGLVAASLLTAGTGAARAATVEVDNVDSPVLRYAAGPGERNELTFGTVEGAWPAAYVVTDPGAVITAGAGCVSLDAHRAFCAARSGAMYRLRATLLDGDDVLHPADFVQLRADGGSGDDRLSGGTWDDRLDGGSGADIIDGGAGTDVVSYEQRTEAVTVDLADPGPDGAAGEGDRLTGIEDVHGGRGEDRLAGTDGPNRFDGGGGDDVFVGRAGRDLFVGTDGGAVDCGPSLDWVRGATARTHLAPSCETLVRSSGDFGFHVRAQPRMTPDGATLPMECDSLDGEPYVCSATVTIRARQRTLARGVLPPGTRRRVARLRLTPAGRALLLRRRTVVATVKIVGRGMPDMAWKVSLRGAGAA